MSPSEAETEAQRPRKEAAPPDPITRETPVLESPVIAPPELPLPSADVIARDVRESRALFALAREQFWMLPPMVVLALLASLFEGVGLTLVIPLIQSLGHAGGDPATQGYLGLLQRLLGYFGANDPTAAVLALILGAVVIKSIFSYANMTLLAIVYGRLSHRLRTAIFDRVISTPLATLERQQSGKLLNTLNNETWRATDALNHVFVIITSAATALVFIVLLVAIDWKMALLSIVCLALIPPVIQLIARHAKALSQVALERNEALAQQTWSTINGLRTIHTFGREDYEQKRFDGISNRVRRLFLRMALVNMTTGPITEIMATAVIAGMVLIVSTDPAGVATIVAFVAILYRLQPRLMSLVGAQTSLAALDASINAVSELLKGESRAESGGEPPALPGGVLSFRNVTFRYDHDAPAAVRDFSFDFPARGIVAIVGASGAGKSTLLDLILGFQFPQAGEVRVGPAVLTAASAIAWRRRTGVVSQDPYVFDDTVRANILYGRPEASEAEMVHAARAVAADEFIRDLPLGYDTRIGERAAQLSGGQRQRISLARAVLRNPDLLLLDEATNALDAQTEAAVKASLCRLAADRTVIIVAHKLASVEIADEVIVMEDGRMVERGSPADLAEADGLFSRMFGRGARAVTAGA